MSNHLEDIAEEVFCQTWTQARSKLQLIHVTEVGKGFPLVTKQFADRVDASRPHSIYVKREASNKYKPHYFLTCVTHHRVKTYKIYAIHHYD